MLCGRNWTVDGGLGSALQESGLSICKDPLWSARILATRPNAIREVHRSYLEAGAEIIITSSYQASIQGFSEHLGVEKDKAIELMECSVHVAREVANEYYAKEGGKGQQPLVAGSIGPYGACQADGSEYNGEYVSAISSEDLIEWHRPRMTALINAGADFLAIETIPALKEALAIIKLLQSFPDTKAWITFSCKDGQYTNYGDKFGKAVKECHEEGRHQIIAVGVNCTPPQHIASLLEQANHSLPPAAELPRVVYPNSGEKWTAGKGWEGRSMEWPFITEIPKWKELGASIIGGCCRLGPRDIKSIAQAVSSMSVT